MSWCGPSPLLNSERNWEYLIKVDQDLPAVREWIEWAEGYVKRIDPLETGLPILLSEEDTLRLSWEYPKDKFP
ncbi:hypothetical protein J2X72_001904 [Phyllobacterium sp. 1468]|nr:hypothetical protein [Phyllobacterium sp. 1468]